MPACLCLFAACLFQELGPVVQLPETGKRYRVSDRAVTIDEALELARLAGGRLLEFDGEAEERAVRQAFGSRRFWLGLTFPREAWASGAPVAWTHWDEGEPSHGDGESFTVAGWNETSFAWNDVSGSEDRFLALIELDEQAEVGPVQLVRAPLGARGALLVVVEGLELRDFEEGFLEPWRPRGTLRGVTAEADPLACWGLATQGVCSAKSGLVSGAEAPAYVWYPNVLARLESLRPELHTAWLLDDPELSRLLASGARTDVRVPERGEAQERAFEELVTRAAPAAIVLGRTLATKKPARARLLEGVEAELSGFLRALEQRADEDWLVLVAGLPPRAARSREAGGRKGAEEERIEVPLLVLRTARPVHALPPEAALADVVPTLIEHLGLAPGIGWGLDGLPLSRPPAAPGLELLVNGGAEQLRTWRNQPGLVPGWSSSGEVCTSHYLRRNFERDGSGPPARGTNLFLGGGSAEEWLEQTIDLAHLAAELDAQGLVAELGGWLGARATTDRRTALVCEALSDAGKVLERSEVEVGSSELRAELGVVRGVARSGLVERRLTLALPAKTRQVRVRLVFRGRGPAYCGADELSLVLRPR